MLIFDNFIEASLLITISQENVCCIKHDKLLCETCLCSFKPINYMYKILNKIIFPFINLTAQLFMILQFTTT